MDEAHEGGPAADEPGVEGGGWRVGGWVCGPGSGMDGWIGLAWD